MKTLLSNIQLNVHFLLTIYNDIIESIVSLPAGTLRPYTEAKSSIMILNRKKPEYLRGKIQFLTAAIFEKDKKSLILNNEDILKEYFSDGYKSKNSQLIDIADLKDDFNISVDAYESQFTLANLMLKEGTGRNLSNLVQIKAGIQPLRVDVDSEGTIPMVKIENLAKDILSINLSKDNLNKVHYDERYERAIVEDECILVARIGDSIKPTIFKPDEETPRILIHNNIYALIVDGDVVEVNLEYLYYQLNSIFVQEQVEKKQLGAVMPYISINALGTLVIPYMPLNAQISFVNSQKANLIAEERKRSEERIKALNYREEVVQTEGDIVRTLVHQLRPTLLSIDMEASKVERIIAKNGVENLKEELKELNSDDLDLYEHLPVLRDYSLGEIVSKLKADTSKLSETLTTVNKVMSFKISDGDFESVDLHSFFEEYLTSRSEDFLADFQIIVKGDKFFVEINKASIKELLDQLLLNAQHHGFQNSGVEIQNRLVQFTLRANREGVAIIEYHNNGASYNLSQEDFIKAFHKSQKSQGSGIGGNYIYRIIEAHHGKMIIKSSRTGFTITFELPIKHKKNDE